ncbi:Nucleic-acid-binding protein from transposon X-element, partial [Stegodyphus mimosarum]
MTRIRTHQPTPLHQIQLLPTLNIESTCDLKYFSLFMIQVEKYTNKNLIAQCHNSPKWHHSSENCFLLPRCVKCAGQHKTSLCPKQGFIENPLCVNCSNSRPASYRGCVKFPKPTIDNPQAPKKLFSEIVANKPSKQNTQQTNNNQNQPNQAPTTSESRNMHSSDNNQTLGFLKFFKAIKELEAIFGIQLSKMAYLINKNLNQ